MISSTFDKHHHHRHRYHDDGSYDHHHHQKSEIPLQIHVIAVTDDDDNHAVGVRMRPFVASQTVKRLRIVHNLRGGPDG